VRDHRSAFGQPRFRIYFPSTCLSTLGSWLIRFLFGWAAWDFTASAFWVGVVASLMLVPTFLLSPLFGIAADRMDPRNGLLVTVSLQGALAALAGLTAYLDLLGLSSLLALAVAFGAVTSAHTPIRLAFLPRLVERAALPSAIGFSAIVFNSSRIIGPAIGAGLLAVTSLEVTFALAALSCMVATLLLTRVTGTGRDAVPGPAASIGAQLRAGLRHVLDTPAIRLVFLLTLTSGLLGRTAIELLPAVSGQMLGGDSSTLAQLTAAAGAGSILGGLIVSRQSGRLRRLFHLVLGGLTLAALVLLTATLWFDVRSAAFAIGLVSLSTTMIGTGCQALVQLSLDEELRGRVMSLWTVVAMGAPAVGAVLVGSLADVVGFPPAFAGVAIVALVVVIAARGRRDRY
jgi:MFS family permease